MDEPMSGQRDTAELTADAETREATSERARPAGPSVPPATWGADDHGPGSPTGSVRPPDSGGTADAWESSRPGPGRRGLGMTLLAALVGAVLGTAGTLALGRDLPDAFQDVRAPVVDTNGDGGTSGANGVAAVAEAVTPSVVRVDRFVTRDGVAQQEGLGSGVIYRSDGYIITNNHVVEGADTFQVKLANGESIEARIVGTDPLTDLAVLKVDRAGLPAINVREGAIDVGEVAVAIGAPFELEGSVTAGVVSAVNRSLTVPIEGGVISIPNVIQTDAAINPGNSGGALVDANGRLIGINSAILSSQRVGQAAGNIGIGFAISVSDVVTVADQLIEQGFARHPRLGIQGGDLTATIAEQYRLDVTEGVLVDEVTPGGPAEESGLQGGDVIVRAAGERIEGMDQLVAIIRRHEPGDTLALTILRDGQEREIDVVLGEWEQ